MRILLVATELAEVAAVGGIAEYLLGLATSLLKRGHEVRVALPAYAYLRSRDNLETVARRLPVRLGVGASELTSVQRFSLPCAGDSGLRLPVLLLGEHKHLASVRSPADIYQWPNHEPWIAFSRAVVDWLLASDWQPDVVHCQDAHTALVPVYIQQGRKQDRQEQGKRHSAKAKTVLTVHNLLNQGIGEPGLVSYAGLPASLFGIDGFEYYGLANCFKAGLLAADQVNAVSRTYAQEICSSSDYGFGLEGVLQSLWDRGRLSGIVNGIDESRWRLAGLCYDGSDDDLAQVRAAKQAARQRLYPAWGWENTPRPLLAYRSRWDEQKGSGLLVDSLPAILEMANVVIVTWGYGKASGVDDKWERLQQIAADWPQRLLVNPSGVGEHAQLAEHYAVSDFFLMPSIYEPCGLTQMECQRYGTIPIVRQTGGLADTVSADNGFLFREMRASAVVECVRQACLAYSDTARLGELIRGALTQRNDWDSRVADYEALYGA